MSKDTLFSIVDKLHNEIIEIGTRIFKNPEMGFKEYKTIEQIKEVFEKYDISYELEKSVTGVIGRIGNGKGVTIGLMADLDGIPTYGHPFAGEDSSVAHSCGHSIQIAIMMGVLMTLVEAGFFEKYDGNVIFFGTPAEEFCDLEFRKALKEQGKIRFLSGKQDMIANGVFDGVDLMISCHTMGQMPQPSADVNSTLNGFIYKSIEYFGKAAHAGAMPHLGINALNAAMIGMNAVHVQRETFEDQNHIRVHSVITKGGQTVNSVPEYVAIESYVRGSTMEAILDANEKVNRAFEAGAYAVGARISITDINGYIPFCQSQELSAIVKENLKHFISEENIMDGKESMASGDVGDLSVFMPTIQFGFSGVSGRVHGSDLLISDEQMAYIIPTKVILGTILDLLSNQSEKARIVIEKFTPSISKEEYLKKWLHLN